MSDMDVSSRVSANKNPTYAQRDDEKRSEV
jgi:hypothetical protein